MLDVILLSLFEYILFSATLYTYMVFTCKPLRSLCPATKNRFLHVQVKMIISYELMNETTVRKAGGSYAFVLFQFLLWGAIPSIFVLGCNPLQKELSNITHADTTKALNISLYKLK